MIVIGITGSIASGKSTVSKLISRGKYPIFSADKIVSDLYKKSQFISLINKKFNLNGKKKIKEQVKLIIKTDFKKIKDLEAIIHPLVRKKMKDFLKKKRRFLILEIPLLIENKLNKYFDKIIYVETRKKLRLKRYLKHNPNKKMFETLNKRQLPPTIKKKFCDQVINNNYSLAILKKNVRKFIENYE
jgi:dephospho-CoA kinase